MKVFLPLFDVVLNGGPSAVVPRTHRVAESPQQVARFGSQGGLQADTVRLYCHVLVCVCVCVRARARVCVCVAGAERSISTSLVSCIC